MIDRLSGAIVFGRIPFSFYEIENIPLTELRTYCVYRVSLHIQKDVSYTATIYCIQARNETTHVCLSGIARCVQHKSEITN
jgi:hypothetical protein